MAIALEIRVFMLMNVANWIFVTGAPRSGTTFVGKMLSARLEVDYIHEPFNPDCGVPGIEQRYLYLRTQSAGVAHYEQIIKRIFTYDFSLKTGYYENDSPHKRLIKKLVGSRGPFYLRLAKLNPFRKAVVIKDPVGCLMVEYLANNFGVKPVILVRHPVAFVASILRIGWEVDLEPIRRQPELVADYFSDDLEFLQKTRDDRIEIIAALWRALNKVLAIQAERNPLWCVVRHEDISLYPLETFHRLYDRLGLPWSSRVEKMIRKRTSAKNKVEAAGGRVQDFNRNSAGLFDLRRNMLSARQRRMVYEVTQDIALKFYEPESFGLNEPIMISGKAPTGARSEPGRRGNLYERNLRESTLTDMKPNFLFIGPDKSGSTWLYRILLQHPDCYVPSCKDIYFFDRYYHRGMDWYLSFFADAPAGTKAVGELSHDYLFSAVAAERIARDLPGVKLMVSLRQPLDRTFSHYLYMVRNGRTREPFELALKKYPDLVDKSMYSKHLSEYFRRFDRSQIQVLFFDDLKFSPRLFAAEVFQFLDVPFIQEIDYGTEVLPASRPRSHLLARLAKISANACRDAGLSPSCGRR